MARDIARIAQEEIRRECVARPLPVAEWRLLEGAVSAPVMPTLHPAFLLRQPQAKRQVWADLLALTARLDDPAEAG